MILLLIAFVISISLCYILIHKLTAIVAKDIPNERSLHSTPVPRLGGVAVLVATYLSWLCFAYTQGFTSEIIYISGSGLLVALISFIDDYINLSQIGRFMVHIAATILVVSGTFGNSLSLPILTFFVIATIWMINLYNFMDGMDGFSGGMAMFGFAFLGLAGYLQGNIVYSLHVAVISISSLGFLLFNFPPAKIFMGDVGSVTLGLFVSAFSLFGLKLQIFPLWFPFLVFSPFIIDATVTILRRAFNREKIWMPHQKHFYQRLILNGWSHRKTVLWEYVLMILCGLSAIAMLKFGYEIQGLIAWVLIYLILGLLVEKKVSAKVPFIEQD